MTVIMGFGLGALNELGSLRSRNHSLVKPAVHPQRRGCLILEHAKAGTTDWGIAAAQIATENRERVRVFLEASNSEASERIAHYVATNMLGLSAAAREGWDEVRLLAVTETAAKALNHCSPHFSKFLLKGFPISLPR